MTKKTVKMGRLRPQKERPTPARRHSPVGVDDLAEGQLAAHLEVALVLREVSS